MPFLLVYSLHVHPCHSVSRQLLALPVLGRSVMNPLTYTLRALIDYHLSSVNTFFYGIVCYQYMTYATTRFNDPLWIKAVVGAFFVLDTTYSSAVIYMVWHYTIVHFGDMEGLLYIIWVLPFIPAVSALISCLTQLFLGYRMWRLTRNLFLYLFVGLMSTVAFALAMVAFAKVTRLESNLQLYTIQKWVTAWLSLQVAVDAIISSVLAYTLVRSRTGFDASDTVINRLVRTTIQSGILCGLFSMLALVMFLAKPYTQLYAVAGYPIGRLYTNAVMDSLLCRKFMRGMLGHGNETRVLGSSFKLQVRKDVETEIRFGETPSGRETVDTKTQGEQCSKFTV